MTAYVKMCRTLEINLLTAKHAEWSFETLFETIPQTASAASTDH